MPYVVRGAARFFDRPEVRQATAMIRGTVKAGEVEGDTVPQPGARGAHRPVGWTAEAPSRGQARDRWESLQALVSQAEEFAAQQPDADARAGFVAELDRRAHEQHAPVAEGVTLATLHAAKGLEWDAVFLCGVQEGSMPIIYATTPAEVEEERRLLYVGVTRAAQAPPRLLVAGAQPGPAGAAQAVPVPARPAARRCVAGDASGPVSRPAGKSRSRSRKAMVCRICQSALASSKERNRGYCDDCPVPYDEELFGSLKAWRKERADAESVPAYVVFSDATLEALAEVRPTDRQALLRINGIGAAKLEKYADDVLEILA